MSLFLQASPVKKQAPLMPVSLSALLSPLPVLLISPLPCSEWRSGGGEHKHVPSPLITHKGRLLHLKDSKCLIWSCIILKTSFPQFEATEPIDLNLDWLFVLLHFTLLLEGCFCLLWWRTVKYGESCLFRWKSFNIEPLNHIQSSISFPVYTGLCKIHICLYLPNLAVDIFKMLYLILALIIADH